MSDKIQFPSLQQPDVPKCRPSLESESGYSSSSSTSLHRGLESIIREHEYTKKFQFTIPDKNFENDMIQRHTDTVVALKDEPDESVTSQQLTEATQSSSPRRSRRLSAVSEGSVGIYKEVTRSIFRSRSRSRHRKNSTTKRDQSRSKSRHRETYLDSVMELKPSSPPLPPKSSTSMPRIAKNPRRQSASVENTNSIVLHDKKKLTRRKSMNVETFELASCDDDAATNVSNSSLVRKSRRISMNVEWNENHPRRSRRLSVHVEASQTKLPVYRSRSRSRRTTAERPKTNNKAVETFEVEPKTVNEVIEDIWFVSLETINRKSVMKFLVKWDGHDISENTFEPYEHINHCQILEEYVERKFAFHQEQIDALCAKFLNESQEILMSFEARAKWQLLRIVRGFDELEYRCSLLAYMYTYNGEVRESFVKKLRYRTIVYQFYKQWRDEQTSNEKTLETIMSNEKYSFRITSENHVDFEPIPKFIYLAKVVYPDTKTVINVGCKCKRKCGKDSPYCCPKSKGWDFVYNEVDGRLCTKEIQMIVECNNFCSCNANCPNRPSKITVDMVLFKTKKHGWGVKTCENIPSGKFIMEYTGELLNKAEASRRAREYHKTGSTYMFDLDYNEKSVAKYSIDATYQGNISRFINHSCNPNLHTWPATTCNEDANIHKLYYFSQRFIRAGEELTIDYTGGRQRKTPADGEEHVVTTKCFCGSTSCKGFIF